MALSATETAYIARVASALTTGTDIGSNARSAAQNYCKLQDLVCVLDILQANMQPPANLVCVVGSTTTNVRITAIPVNAYVGATLTFDAATTTVALRGVTRTVKSNSATEFIVDALPAAPAVADEFSISGGPISGIISSLRDGRGRGDWLSAGVYGDNRVVSDALFTLLQCLAGSIVPSRQVTRAGTVTSAGSTDTVINTVDSYRADELKNKRFVLGGQTRSIISNGENFIVLNKALSSAPAASTAFAVYHDSLDPNHLGLQAVHPGGHAENAVIGSVLTQLSTLVNAFVLPS